MASAGHALLAGSRHVDVSLQIVDFLFFNVGICVTEGLFVFFVSRKVFVCCGIVFFFLLVLRGCRKGELMSFKAVVIERNLTFSLVVFVDVMANSPLRDRCVKVLHKCGVRTALEVLITNRKDVGLVGPLRVDLTILNETTELCLQWLPPLWAAGGHGGL